MFGEVDALMLHLAGTQSSGSDLAALSANIGMSGGTSGETGGVEILSGEKSEVPGVRRSLPGNANL